MSCAALHGTRSAGDGGRVPSLTMRMVWSGAPAEEFLPARDRLVEQFGAWARCHDRHVLPFVVEALVHDRWAVGDGLLGRWQPDDLAEELLVRFPRHLTVAPDDLGAVVPTVQAFVDFLADEALADAHGASRDELNEAAGDMAGTFLTAMGDESMFGLTKFFNGRMVVAGIDPDDAEAAERFVADVQAGRIPIDAELLDQVVANHLDDEIELPPRMPLVILPAADELVALAEKSVVVQHLRALVGWVGAGRELEQDQLRPADDDDLAALVGPGHGLLLRWAREARVVRTVKGKLVRVKAAAPIVADPVALAQGAFEAFFELGEEICGSGPDGSLVRWGFEDATLALVMALYARQGPSPRGDIEDLVYEVAQASVDPDLDEWGREVADTDTGRVLDALAALGAVVDGPDVALSPLGRALVARHLRAHGVPVPGVDALVDETAEVVLAVAAGAGPAERDALMAAWTARNTDARQQLLTLITRTDDHTHRALAEEYVLS